MSYEHQSESDALKTITASGTRSAAVSGRRVASVFSEWRRSSERVEDFKAAFPPPESSTDNRLKRKIYQTAHLRTPNMICGWRERVWR